VAAATILLVPFGELPANTLSWLAHGISAALSVPVTAETKPVDPAFAWDAGRRQHLSTALLERLAETAGGSRVLGVADRDLFVPILTFVFGEAHLGGPAAVFSLTRLRASFYGLPDDDDLLLARALKEALHELGHTFGLTHCARPDCVMRASTSADQVDLKPAAFCRGCRKSLPG